MAPVQRAHLRRGIGHERRRRRDAQAGRAPHVAGVDVEAAVVVVVEEGRAHAGAVVEDARARRDVLERHGAVPAPEVAIEVLGAEVVGDEQVGPAVLVVVGPRGREMVAVVARVEAHLRGDVDESPAAVVAEEHARRSVARVVVRRRRAGLVLAGAEEVRVDAEVQVEEAVAVVVGHRHRRQHALQRPREREGVGRRREAPLAVVDEQQRLQARSRGPDPDRRRCPRRQRATARCRRARRGPTRSVMSSNVPSPRAR